MEDEALKYELMQEAQENDNSIDCRLCNKDMDADSATCPCGWVNPLVGVE